MIWKGCDTDIWDHNSPFLPTGAQDPAPVLGPEGLAHKGSEFPCCDHKLPTCYYRLQVF